MNFPIKRVNMSKTRELLKDLTSEASVEAAAVLSNADFHALTTAMWTIKRILDKMPPHESMTTFNNIVAEIKPSGESEAELADYTARAILAKDDPNDELEPDDEIDNEQG